MIVLEGEGDWEGWRMEKSSKSLLTKDPLRNAREASPTHEGESQGSPPPFWVTVNESNMLTPC